MCMFGGSSGGTRRLWIGGTNLFARGYGDRQYLVYGMNVAASAPVAMILPLPIPIGSAEDAVRFLDLSGYPRFFVDVNDCFPPIVTPPSRGRGGGGGAHAPRLRVHRAGDFEASFVPSLADFDRLDPRFRLSDAVWNALPGYRDWGFAVFQLRDLGGGSGWARWFGRAKPRTIHPMALDFPRRDPDRLFFPTVHVHDGEVHPQGHFDHLLFWQADPAVDRGQVPAAGIHTSPPAQLTVDVTRALGIVDGPGCLHRLEIRGQRPNRDHWAVGRTITLDP